MTYTAVLATVSDEVRTHGRGLMKAAATLRGIRSTPEVHAAVRGLEVALDALEDQVEDTATSLQAFLESQSTAENCGSEPGTQPTPPRVSESTPLQRLPPSHSASGEPPQGELQRSPNTPVPEPVAPVASLALPKFVPPLVVVVGVAIAYFARGGATLPPHRRSA